MWWRGEEKKKRGFGFDRRKERLQAVACTHGAPVATRPNRLIRNGKMPVAMNPDAAPARACGGAGGRDGRGAEQRGARKN